MREAEEVSIWKVRNCLRRVELIQKPEVCERWQQIQTSRKEHKDFTYRTATGAGKEHVVFHVNYTIQNFGDFFNSQI